jgi:antitoxin component YwqK of YwqJK toxin-antitoxin module
LLFGRYKQDLKTGKWTDFYNNGKKKEETTYKIKRVKNALDDVVSMGIKSKQSLEHGAHKAYSQVDYTMKESGKFKKGQKHGKWINFYPGGVVPAVVSYYKNGSLHGEFAQYDRVGNKMNEIHYKKGLKHGWFIVYGRNGKPISQKMFRYGHEMRKIDSEDGFAPR